jgi:hypothetical protein
MEKTNTPNKHIPHRITRSGDRNAELRAARQSPIYWWFMCLRASDEYRICCENSGNGPLWATFVDFGDIFKEDFSMWYMKRGRKLFGESRPFKKVQAFETRRELDELQAKPDSLVLQIPLNIRKQTVMRQIGRILKKAYEGRDIDIWEQSTAKRQIIKSRVKMKTVELLLKIHEIRNTNLTATNYQIGRMAGIELDILARDTSGIDYDDALERRRMTFAVSRYLKQAKQLIKNAERGIFPSLSAAKV